jgi:hypothetical protein
MTKTTQNVFNAEVRGTYSEHHAATKADEMEERGLNQVRYSETHYSGNTGLL